MTDWVGALRHAAEFDRKDESFQRVEINSGGKRIAER
jgi:hypothetical protein